MKYRSESEIPLDIAILVLLDILSIVTFGMMAIVLPTYIVYLPAVAGGVSLIMLNISAIKWLLKGK